MMRTIRNLGAALVFGSVALAGASANAETGTAIFAGGCFWCVEAAFDEVDGVTETTSGYTGGMLVDPSYEEVSAGNTGHAEAVRVRYDTDKVDYSGLLDVFWHNVDPFDAGGQFCDRGSSYRSTIFVEGEDQKRLAEESMAELGKKFDREIVTKVVAATPFYPAEDYHQDYHDKNPLQYKFYKWRCGRAARLEEIWGAPTS